MLKPDSLGKLFILLGLTLVLAGIFLVFFKKIPILNHLGHLPGDIHFQKENFHLYFPITTSIILSVVFSLILYLLHKIGR